MKDDTVMKKHKFADVLIAIANGESTSNFEIKAHDWTYWYSLTSACFPIEHQEKYEIRRKAETIKVNGFDVPKPETKAPEMFQFYYIPDFRSTNFVSTNQWRDDKLDHEWLKRGIVHLDEKSATIHAKAMLSIDPYVGK